MQQPTYDIRTYGCQMNVHDSERLAGLLEAAGYVPAGDGTADVVVLNTCAVRENADNKLYGNLGLLAPVPDDLQRVQVSELMSPLCWDLAHIGHFEELWLVRELADGSSSMPRAAIGD